MPVLINTATSDDFDVALDVMMLQNFEGEADRLTDVLGVASVETVAAGTTINQLQIIGSLNDKKTDDKVVTKTEGEGASATTTVTGFVPGSSSGDEYVEGDLVALSKYYAKKIPVASAAGKPYRKLTSAQAIQTSGRDAAILKTDNKMLGDVRGKIISRFFSYFANGTGTLPEGTTPSTLQAALICATMALEDALEKNNDSSSHIIHFVNRWDVADYLSDKEITTQTLFGMTYIENFLGVQQMFVSSRIPKGTVYATPGENLRILGIDFGTLNETGLVYNTLTNGLIGVAHEPGYDRAGVYTNVMYGAEMFAEVKDYIIKSAITPATKEIPTV